MYLFSVLPEIHLQLLSELQRPGTTPTTILRIGPKLERAERRLDRAPVSVESGQSIPAKVGTLHDLAVVKSQHRE